MPMNTRELCSFWRKIESKSTRVYALALPVLEETRTYLAECSGDAFTAYLTEGTRPIPDEVKTASRDAFAHSGLHGLAVASMDPEEHNKLAIDKHSVALKLARKHGLVRLAQAHRGKRGEHQAKLAQLKSDDD